LKPFCKRYKRIKKTEKKKKKERNKNMKMDPGKRISPVQPNHSGPPEHPNRYPLYFSLLSLTHGPHWSDPPSTPSRFFLHWKRPELPSLNPALILAVSSSPLCL
jgi:hypothetical protein